MMTDSKSDEPEDLIEPLPGNLANIASRCFTLRTLPYAALRYVTSYPSCREI